MKKLLPILGLLFSSNSMAAIGTGHAQAELTKPLSITFVRNVNFGTISIDPSAGPQTIPITMYGTVTCPLTYVCAGSPIGGLMYFYGSPNIPISVSISGETATLTDGNGNSIIFDPSFGSGDTHNTMLDNVGYRALIMGGEISFTGNESEGVYSSTNARGGPKNSDSVLSY
ncbi:MAG: DUF4402 domain-containing protein [Alphaproteobacteria bacterium]|nr:DUF4402 domain-containing protein [Alphaproteobacteria bacterium]